MCQIDKNAPTEEEHRLKGVTKPRYMVWRETISSTASLGFRIEGLRKADGTSTKDFKTTKSKEQIIKAFRDFTKDAPHVVVSFLTLQFVNNIFTGRCKLLTPSLSAPKCFANVQVRNETNTLRNCCNFRSREISLLGHCTVITFLPSFVYRMIPHVN